jgi:hypothetical protein
MQRPLHDASDHQHWPWVRRRVWVLPLSDEIAVLRHWLGLRAVIVTETIRQMQHQLGTHAEIRYYLPNYLPRCAGRADGVHPSPLSN